MSKNRGKGIPFIISAPSGTGKSTLLKRLLDDDPRCVFSISHTTRGPRVGEREGVDYYFTDVQGFQEKIDASDFLEWARVHGNHYGTSHSAVCDRLGEGYDVFLDIDVQGAELVRARLEESVSIFILPPAYGTLRQRLIDRGKDAIEVIEHRLEVAKTEIKHYRHFDYVLINNDLDTCYLQLRQVVAASRLRVNVVRQDVRTVLDSFAQ